MRVKMCVNVNDPQKYRDNLLYDVQLDIVKDSDRVRGCRMRWISTNCVALFLSCFHSSRLKTKINPSLVLRCVMMQAVVDFEMLMKMVHLRYRS